MKKKLSYTNSGVDYSLLDPIKKAALRAGKKTAKNPLSSLFYENQKSRGESAYVWTVDKKKHIYMASVIEGLGTKNLVADHTELLTHTCYYDIIGHDTVATIINDLVSVGATPLVMHAYWATGDSDFLKNERKMSHLINGWKQACDIAHVAWGGGETPTLSGIIEKGTIDLGGAAVGLIEGEEKLLNENKLQPYDRILLIKSNGINANGISLTRNIAHMLPNGYATKLPNDLLFGEAILTRTNIYATLISNLQKENIDLHYISNITGHGLRKIMRAGRTFSYILTSIFEPQAIFPFIQYHAQLSEYEMYETYNMGQDYAIFLPEKHMKKALEIVEKNNFEGLNAGYIEKGKRQVIIQPKNITFTSETLNLK